MSLQLRHFAILLVFFSLFAHAFADDLNAPADSNSPQVGADANIQTDANSQIDTNSSNFPIDSNSGAGIGDENSEKSDQNIPIPPIVPVVVEDVNSQVGDINVHTAVVLDAAYVSSLKDIAADAVKNFETSRRLVSLAPEGDKAAARAALRESVRLALLSQIDYFSAALRLAQKNSASLEGFLDAAQFLEARRPLLADQNITDGNLAAVSSELNVFWGKKRAQLSDELISDYVSRLEGGAQKISEFGATFSGEVSSLKQIGKDTTLLEAALTRLTAGKARLGFAIDALLVPDGNAWFFSRARIVAQNAGAYSSDLYDLMGYMFFAARDLENADEIELATKEKLEEVLSNDQAAQALDDSLAALGYAGAPPAIVPDDEAGEDDSNSAPPDTNSGVPDLNTQVPDLNSGLPPIIDANTPLPPADMNSTADQNTQEPPGQIDTNVSDTNSVQGQVDTNSSDTNSEGGA